jgi:hypothetical protein
MRASWIFLLILTSGAAQAQINLEPSKTVWDRDLDGTALHRISTLQCPTGNGAFRRYNIQLYDKVGFDVACDYRIDGAEITLYLTRIDPAEFDQHFEVARKAIADRFPGAASREASLPHPPGFEWRHASFALPKGMISDVLMAPLHGWSFKARISYQPQNADVTAKAVAELSALALRTAGQHLAACEARPPMPADGQRVTDKQKLLGLGVVTGALMGKIETNGVLARPKKLPDQHPFCADDTFSVGNDNFVFWRGISSNGTTVERITGIEREFAAETRDVFTDILAELSAAEGGKPVSASGSKPPGIAVLVDRGEDWDLMAVFEGVPSMKDMAETALLGSPVARISKAGNKTTIFTDPAAK